MVGSCSDLDARTTPKKTIVIAGLKWLINTYIEEGAITKEKADQLLEEVIIGKIEDIHHHL